MDKVIFIVDDSDTNLAMAEAALEEYYEVITLPSAARMFAMFDKVVPDLILMDIAMPEMNGFEALHILKESEIYADIPVMFLTSMTDPEVEVRGFELGVVDFVTKPFTAPVLLNRIKTHLNIDMLIRERTARLQKLQHGLVFVLADMVENRDKATGGHVERTAHYLTILINAIIQRGLYLEEITRYNIESLISSARLHDVGKIAIPDAILNKPGKLTPEEFETMKTHVQAGEHIIDQIISRTGEVGFLRNARLFVCYHHERWDGTGYPYGLAGEDIPLQGRIMALVDVYDALISVRPYKEAFSEEKAMSIILEGAGRQFDPQLAEIFNDVRDQLYQVTEDMKKQGTGA